MRTDNEDTAMIEIHPSFIERDGRTEFVVLPIEEYRSLRDHLEEMEDLLDLRTAKIEEGAADTIPLETLKRELY